MQVIREHGEELVIDKIKLSLNKCALGLNINLQPESYETLAADILEVYQYDSVEDVIQCLKKGRQGKYGFGHNNRQSITMILIKEWMALHLEEKAIAREKELQNQKKKVIPRSITDEEGKEIDMYEIYRKRQAVEKEKEKVTNEHENEFQRLKLEYIKKNPKSESKEGPIEQQVKQDLKTNKKP